MDEGYARPTAKARQLRNNATDTECALWRAISARKVAGVRFNRQAPIGPYICDVIARSLLLVVEADGGQHSAGTDAARTRYLEAEGYRVIRFWNDEVLGNLDGAAAEIEPVIADTPSPDPSRKREGSL